MSTKVISIRVKNLRTQGYDSLEEWLKDPIHIYIGRQNAYVKGTFRSKWCNPFSVKKYGREGCIEAYRNYILSNAELMGSLEELRGKTLGCWCKPEACHGDILVDLVEKHK